MPILRLSAELRETCTAIARASLPNEACALLQGFWDGDDVVLTRVHPVENARASPTRFTMDGLGMMSAEQTIDESGDDLVGVLHSHPTSQAYPSATDLNDASTYDPGHIYLQLIVSLQGFTPTLRAFRYGTSEAETVEFVFESIHAP